MDAHKTNGNTHGNFSLPRVDSSDGGSSHGSSWTEDTVRKCCSKKTLYKRIPLLSLIENYHKGLIVADLVAGVTVGLTMVPQSIAYASVAGLPPQVIAAKNNASIWLLKTRNITFHRNSG